MSDIFNKAVDFAFKAHEGQLRKDGTVYILHPLEVATIVGTITSDPAVLSAAVLHDTVEDTAVTAEEILDNFGPEISELVAHETEDKRHELPPEQTWKIRKEESLMILRDAPLNTKILWLGDKLSNMRGLSRMYDKIGMACFDGFNEKNPKEQKWYHETVLDYIKELKDYPAYKEYETLFHCIFDQID